jgi:hypothetical protein
MNPLIDFWNDGDTWLIGAVLNDQRLEKEEMESAAELSSQNQLMDNHNSLSTSLKHHHAMDSSLTSMSSPSHGAVTTDTDIQDSSLGGWIYIADSEQETEDDLVAEYDDIAQETPASTSLGDWGNEVNEYADFDVVKSQFTSSEDGDTESSAALSDGSENDELLGSPMNQSTTRDEDLATDPEETNSESSDFETDSMEDDDNETKEDFKQRLIYWIAQMMFVSGETAEPSPETTWMIEEIVREQVLEMVCTSLFLEK